MDEDSVQTAGKWRHTEPEREIGPSSDNAKLDLVLHRKALLKLDLILLTTVTVIYFLNFLDR
jgi:hypothetical protein